MADWFKVTERGGVIYRSQVPPPELTEWRYRQWGVPIEIAGTPEQLREVDKQIAEWIAYCDWDDERIEKELAETIFAGISIRRVPEKLP
jgi:hypothetical protein